MMTNVSINDTSSNRKRKSHNDQHSTKRSQNKQRKQVTFSQVQQNSSEVSDKTSSMSEISPILETYEQQLQTFQLSNTFETLGATSTQSPVQSTVYHNESQPMTTHQRAALAQAALVNFFGESGTVTSILNSVQPSHTQTLSEVSDLQDLNISQQGRSLPVSTQTYTIPCISDSTQPNTHTTTQRSTKQTKLQSTTLLYRFLFF